MSYRRPAICRIGLDDDGRRRLDHLDSCSLSVSRSDGDQRVAVLFVFHGRHSLAAEVDLVSAKLEASAALQLSDSVQFVFLWFELCYFEVSPMKTWNTPSLP